MLRIIDALLSWGVFIGTAVCAFSWLVLAFQWRSYFKQHAKATLAGGTLLEAISIGVTAVSILLPTTGALLIYYLSRITADRLQSAYPLITAIVFLGLSLFVGLWNTFSLATQYSGSTDVTWTKGQIGHILFFASQFIFFAAAVLVLSLFLAFNTLDVTDLLKKPI